MSRRQQVRAPAPLALRGDLAGPTGVACTADGRILIADADEDVDQVNTVGDAVKFLEKNAA